MRRSALVLMWLMACERPVLSLAERPVDAASAVDASDPPDADADQDEQVIPCSSAAECPDRREPDDVLCDLVRGQCVECLRDADCPLGERCDGDGECDD